MLNSCKLRYTDASSDLGVHQRVPLLKFFFNLDNHTEYRIR
jgi:hypothetical protein